MALTVSDRHRQVVNAGTQWTFTRASIGMGNRVPDGTETALVMPFNPPREKQDPPGIISDYQRIADWIDGFTGDTDSYDAHELALWATPAGGQEYLAAYESKAAGAIFSKAAGSPFQHRAAIGISAAESVNGNFVVPAVPVGTTKVPGVVQYGDPDQVAAPEGVANRVPSLDDVLQIIRAFAPVDQAKAPDRFLLAWPLLFIWHTAAKVALALKDGIAGITNGQIVRALIAAGFPDQVVQAEALRSVDLAAYTGPSGDLENGRFELTIPVFETVAILHSRDAAGTGSSWFIAPFSALPRVLYGDSQVSYSSGKLGISEESSSGALQPIYIQSIVVW